VRVGRAPATYKFRNSIARLTIGFKDKDFTYHIWDLFNSIGLAEPYSSTQTRKAATLTTAYHFATFSLPSSLPYLTSYLMVLHWRVEDMLQVIPSNIVELLTPIAFAYWLCAIVATINVMAW